MSTHSDPKNYSKQLKAIRNYIETKLAVEMDSMPDYRRRAQVIAKPVKEGSGKIAFEVVATVLIPPEKNIDVLPAGNASTASFAHDLLQPDEQKSITAKRSRVSWEGELMQKHVETVRFTADIHKLVSKLRDDTLFRTMEREAEQSGYGRVK
jgi:hypothetical protein